VRHRWGHGRSLPFQRWLLRRLASRPTRSYFLALAPEIAFERKQDFPLDNLRERAALYEAEYGGLGARRLDAELPRERLCAQIARDVWRDLG
jgi:hypothetical protein